MTLSISHLILVQAELESKLKSEREAFSSQAEEIKTLEDTYNAGVKEYEVLEDDDLTF